ncbi:MAG TPA: methyltransferase domain-containing protein [Polyangia bacterium]
MNAEAAVAVVTDKARARVLARHPWIFRQDIVRGPATDARTGGPRVVTVQDTRGRRLGLATWAATAKLALRMLTTDERGDRDGSDLIAIIASRLAAARARRGGIARERDAFRLIHGEGDALPGLFVDVYADVAVVQTTSVAMDAALAEIAPLVQEATNARLVIERNDGSTRDFEELPRRSGILCGEGSAEVSYQLGPNRLLANLLEDGKTGGFLDQADNHAAVAALAPRGARCLDAFTYHGGFALALARRGGTVHANDEDRRAVERTRRNAEENGLANLQVTQGNAFDLLRSLEGQGARFDVVVIDPPALAKRKSDAGAADRAYKELILRGLRITEAGGLTVACSCSGRVSRAHWDEIIADAAADAGKSVQVLARLGAGRDHPELLGVPETAHLKCWILRVL